MGAIDAFDKLNEKQREAAQSSAHPLLIIAGAGTGKTNTLAHRVAHLVLEGAALEMTRRAGRIVAEAHKSVRLPWSGTFHCAAVGLTESFSVLDRGGRRWTAAGDVGVISCRKIEKGLNSVR